MDTRYNSIILYTMLGILGITGGLFLNFQYTKIKKDEQLLKEAYKREELVQKVYKAADINNNNILEEKEFLELAQKFGIKQEKKVVPISTLINNLEKNLMNPNLMPDSALVNYITEQKK